MARRPQQYSMAFGAARCGKKTKPRRGLRGRDALYINEPASLYTIIFSWWRSSSLFWLGLSLLALCSSPPSTRSMRSKHCTIKVVQNKQIKNINRTGDRNQRCIHEIHRGHTAPGGPPIVGTFENYYFFLVAFFFVAFFFAAFFFAGIIYPPPFGIPRVYCAALS